MSLLAVNETTARRVIPARATVAVAEAIEPRSIEVTTGPKVPTKPVTRNSKPINKKATAKNNDNKPYNARNQKNSEGNKTNRERKPPVEINNLERLNLGEVKTSLAPGQKQELLALLERYSHLFAESDLELGSTDRVKCSLDTGNARPIRQRPYRIPFLQKTCSRGAH